MRIIYVIVIFVSLLFSCKCRNSSCCDKGGDCSKGNCECQQAVGGKDCDVFYINEFIGTYLGNCDYSFTNGSFTGSGTLSFDSLVIKQMEVSNVAKISISVDNLMKFNATILNDTEFEIYSQTTDDGCQLSGNGTIINGNNIRINLHKIDVDYTYDFIFDISLLNIVGTEVSC